MTRYRLDLAYDGTAYSGFAVQPGRRTIRGELEAALAIAFHEPVRVACAGRTDAGVHAIGQVVAFDGPKMEARRLAHSLSGLMPPDIRPLAVAEADPAFDPRRDALAREYHYRLALGPAPLVKHFVWEQRKPLDGDAMRAAAVGLVGSHDFTSFCLSDAPEPHVRELMRLDVVEESLAGVPVLVVRALANAFLHGMVRAIVGTLVEVGRGRHEPAWATTALEAKNRGAAGPSAPAHGLVLVRVYYEGQYLVEAATGAGGVG